MSHNYIHVHAAGDCISNKRPGDAAAAGLRTTLSRMAPESEDSARCGLPMFWPLYLTCIIAFNPHNNLGGNSCQKPIFLDVEMETVCGMWMWAYTLRPDVKSGSPPHPHTTYMCVI